MSREELHRLVDSLPEGAIEPAEKALHHFQIWPPRQPPEIARIKQENLERFRRSMRPGTVGGFGGGGSYKVNAEGHVQQGRYSSSRWEDKTEVVETHHFHDGHEITVTERLRTGDDGKTVVYATEIVGPKGEGRNQEITFDVA